MVPFSSLKHTVQSDMTSNNKSFRHCGALLAMLVKSVSPALPNENEWGDVQVPTTCAAPPQTAAGTEEKAEIDARVNGVSC